MAKQRRVRPRSATPKQVKSSAHGAAGKSGKPEDRTVGAHGARPSAPLPAPPPPARRTTYPEAVGLYERGLQALQRHDYRGAAERLRSVLTCYPEEKELHERVRLYLNICERQEAPKESTPTTFEERLYAATLALNSGANDKALAHLRAAHAEDPENDHALYMLAVVHALRGEPAAALPFLQRALELNPDNRALARQDPDLESLRREEQFRAIMEATATSRPDRRRPARGRSSR